MMSNLRSLRGKIASFVFVMACLTTTLTLGIRQLHGEQWPVIGRIAEINMGEPFYFCLNGDLYPATPSMLYAVASDEKETVEESRQEPGSWSQFFGPARTNRSPETDLLNSWPQQGPPLSWKINGLGNGLAPPAVANGRIYTTGNRSDNDQLICLDETTGRELWSVVLRANVPEYRRMRWLNQRTPTVDGDRVYAVSEYGDLVCVDAPSGVEVWRKDYATDFEGKRPVYGYCDYPLVDGNRLICTPNGKHSTHVALNKLTGEVLWRSSVADETNSSPGTGYSACVIFNSGGVRQYVQLFQGMLISLKATNGQLLWRYDDDFANPAANVYVPIVRDDLVFCANCYGKGCVLLKIGKNDGTLTVGVEYRRQYDFQFQHSCTVLVGDHVYAGFHKGALACLNFKTGDITWKRENAIEGIAASPTFADGHLYLRHRDGVMTLVKADSAGYVERGRYTLPLPSEEPNYTYPVIANGHLLIRHDDVLLCYEIRSAAGGREDSNHIGGAARPRDSNGTTKSTGYWPQWRGPDRDNVSRDKALLAEWPQKGPPMTWQVEGIGEGVASLAITGGRVFTLGYIGESEYAIALDEATGELLWRVRIGTAVKEQSVMRWLSQRTPTVDGERLYVFTAAGELACLSTSDGQELWRKNYVQDFEGKRGSFGYCDFPLVDGDKLICTPGGQLAGMVALDKKTGKSVWKCRLPEPERSAYAAALAVEIAGVRQYVNVLSQSIIGVSASDGKLLWRHNKFRSGPGNTYPAIVQGNRVFCPSSGGNSVLLTLKRTASGFEIAQTRRIKGRFQPWLGSAVLVDGYVYSFATGLVYCFDLATGDVVWRERITGADGSRSSLTYADGRVYVRSQRGQLLLLNVSPKGYKVAGQVAVVPVADQPTWSFPVVAGGRLYLRDQHVLSCYDVSEKAIHEPIRGGKPLSLRPPDAKKQDRFGERIKKKGKNRAPDAIFVPTPQDVVNKMLELAKVKKSDVVYDLGSGDGRFVIAAAKTYGCKAFGYEIDPELVGISRKKIEEAKLGELARIEHEDIFTLDLTDATVITVFLYPHLLERLLPQFKKLKPGSRIVSHHFEIPGVKPEKVIYFESKEDGDKHRVYMWTVPIEVTADK